MDRRQVHAYFQRPSGASIGVLLLTILIGFGAGYWFKYKQVAAASKVLKAQAAANNELDIRATALMQERELSLQESLRSIGLTDYEIGDLYEGEDTKINRLRKKFTEYLPGKTKWLKGETVYLPRTDCQDDFLGIEMSNEVNRVIIEGRDNRQENQ